MRLTRYPLVRGRHHGLGHLDDGGASLCNQLLRAPPGGLEKSEREAVIPEQKKDVGRDL